MAGARITPSWVERISLAVLLAALVLGGVLVSNQPASDAAEPSSRGPGPLFPESRLPGPSDARSPEVPDDARPVNAGTAALDEQDTVIQVRVTGNGKIPLEKILPHIRTRAGRPFDAELIEEDVRRLNGTHMFVQVKPYSQKVSGGRVVIFEVLERPMLHYVRYVGNKLAKRTLEKEAGIKPGDALDTFAVEEARRRIEEYYHTHGYPKARVTIVEGNKSSDRGAIFVINEGQKQRILWTDFVGNTIATDARLRTQIQAKPGFLWIFKGEVDRRQIDEDKNRLTAYYRSLGFFRAVVGTPILDFNEQGNWLKITYVIDEGPRYQVRNVSFIGNTKFATEELAAKLKLQGGQPFDQSQMKADVISIQDTYGSVGYVFADIQADPRFLEEPGTLDLVYNIQEGEQFRVGKINVKIKGEFPHTRITTVLNRMSIYPGDIVDVRELRASERRLKASGLFENDPAAGVTPKIVFSPPSADSVIARQPKAPGNVRSQSPDTPTFTIEGPASCPVQTRQIDLTIEGTYIGGARVQEEEPLEGERRQMLRVTTPPTASNVTATPFHGAQSVMGAGLAQPQAVPPQAFNHAAPQGLVPVAPRPVMSDDRQLRQAQDALERLVNAPRPQTAAAPPGSYPVQPTQYMGPAAPVRAEYDSFAPEQPAPPRMSPSEVPLRGDFGRPTDGVIIRGQYSTDAGRATPSLSRGLNWGGKTPVSLTSNPSPTTSTLPPPAGLSTSTPYTVRTVQPSQPLPTAQAYPAPPAYPTASPAQSYSQVQAASPYTNQAAPPSAYVPPIDRYPVAQLGAGGPTIADAEPLLGGRPDEQPLYIPLDPTVTEARTGRLMFSVGVNSEAGVLGSVIIDEQNFDWTRFPRSFEDIRNGTAFRGDGQRFRAEFVPGSELQRYSVSFQEPYLLDTQVSLSLSGFYYDRRFREWTEQRVGGRVGLGYQLTPDLSAMVAFRGESVDLTDPIIPTPPTLAAALGQSSLYGFELQLSRDTRDSPYMPTEGSLIKASVEQVIGTYEYPRFELDMRRYFMLAQRPDGSGRQVLSLSGRLSITGDDTPIYEHYFAGGFSTIRGFDFRGASPREQGVLVGGEFMALASAEYMFPITADDMIRGVVFVDTGTVEPTIDNWTDRYRVAPGFGFRITIPAMGPAPIAVDLAFPISHEDGDDIENFSFFVGFLR